MRIGMPVETRVVARPQTVRKLYTETRQVFHQSGTGTLGSNVLRK